MSDTNSDTSGSLEQYVMYSEHNKLFCGLILEWLVSSYSGLCEKGEGEISQCDRSYHRKSAVFN